MEDFQMLALKAERLSHKFGSHQRRIFRNLHVRQTFESWRNEPQISFLLGVYGLGPSDVGHLQVSVACGSLGP